MRRFGFDNSELEKIKTLAEAKRLEKILESNIQGIRYVSDWCQLAGISKSKLTIIIKSTYKLSPKKHLMLFRFQKIKKMVTEDPQVPAKIVASFVGLETEQSLYKFLSRNFSTSFTSLRNKILTQLFLEY